MKTFIRRALVAASIATLSLSVLAGEVEVRKGLNSIMREEGGVVSLQKTPYGGLHEVVLSNGDIVYVDDKGGFLIHGTLIDLKSKKNVTAARESELNRINITELPLAQAVKQVRGSGKRILVTFEDPNCSYCKKLAKELKDVKDTTIYTFMIPILSPDSMDKSRNIWCAKDRAAAWNDWMTENKAPADAQCDNPIQKNAEMARKYRITGTPTMFLADGSRLGGYLPPAELEQRIVEAESKAKAKPAK